MSYKQIETSREIRLWIRDIIVPAVMFIGTVFTLHPELKEKAKTKLSDVKNSMKVKFNK